MYQACYCQNDNCIYSFMYIHVDGTSCIERNYKYHYYAPCIFSLASIFHCIFCLFQLFLAKDSTFKRKMFWSILGWSFPITSVIIFIDIDEEMIGNIRTNTFQGVSEHILTLIDIDFDAALWGHKNAQKWCTSDPHDRIITKMSMTMDSAVHGGRHKRDGWPI